MHVIIYRLEWFTKINGQILYQSNLTLVILQAIHLSIVTLQQMWTEMLTLYF